MMQLHRGQTSKTQSTLFSTKTELLAVSQTAKEVIYLSQLMNSLILILSKALTIKCVNQQIIRLLVKKAIKVQTKLRHIDIYSH